MPRRSDDKYLDLLSAAITALASDRDQANKLAFSLAATRPDRLLHKSISKKTTVAVFRHDRYSCRYCGSRVVPPPILRAASLLWPELLPYNPNWRTDVTHPIFAARTASIDHIHPRSRGGAEDVDNFVTACWPCNTQKADQSLERLGWKLLEITTEDWDGLVNSYPVLWSTAKHNAIESDVRYHLSWLKSFGFSGLGT